MKHKNPILNDSIYIIEDINPTIEYEVSVSEDDMRNIIQLKQRGYEDTYNTDYESEYHYEIFEQVKEKLLRDYTEEEIEEQEDYILDIIRDNTITNIIEDQDHKILFIPNDELWFNSEDKRWLDHRTEDHKVLMKLLDILQINPLMFIKLYQDIYNIEEEMKQNDFDIEQWKDIKRIPYVDVEDFITEMETSPGYGLLTFLGCIKEHEDFFNNAQKWYKYLKIPKGTTYGFYDSWVGGGSEMSATVIRDLYIEMTDSILQLENDYHYSVDSCYGFVNSVWYDSNFTMSDEKGITYNQVYDTARHMLNSYTEYELKIAAELLQKKRHDVQRLPTHTDKTFLEENIKCLRYTTLVKHKNGKLIVFLDDIRKLLLQAESELENYKRNTHLDIKL